jgi:hypothetical protein
MAQLPAMAIMDFVQRFQALQVQRDTGDELIKVGPAPAPLSPAQATILELLWDLVVTSLGPIDIL